MSKVKISPCNLSGTVKIPSSKSVAHRAIICAALSKGDSRIDNVTFSDDITATIGAMRELGAKIDVFSDYVLVNGENTFSQKAAKIDCNMSGSTLRFVIPIALSGGIEAEFIGRESLFLRPLTVYKEIMEKQGISFNFSESSVSLNGKLLPDTFFVRGDISSQFVTGLLFSLPLLENDSQIILTTPLQSKGYIDLTIKVLSEFGITIENNSYESFLIKGNQVYKPHNFEVEGDFSQSAFFLCADALGADVWVQGLDDSSLQGDKIVLDILKAMGCEILHREKKVKAVRPEKLKPLVIDSKDCPDIVPSLAVVAAFADGRTDFINCERLKIKESDRFNAVTENLENVGVSVEKTDNSFSIYGIDSIDGGNIKTFNDHRIAMAFAILSCISRGELTLDDKECVAKSYPDFWSDFTQLGGIINEC